MGLIAFGGYVHADSDVSPLDNQVLGADTFVYAGADHADVSL
jgi:ABC-type sugar transport system substrate-binding protein